MPLPLVFSRASFRIDCKLWYITTQKTKMLTLGIKTMPALFSSTTSRVIMNMLVDTIRRCVHAMRIPETPMCVDQTQKRSHPCLTLQ